MSLDCAWRHEKNIEKVYSHPDNEIRVAFYIAGFCVL